MSGFLLYQGKVAIIMAVFYLFYHLMLGRETFHRMNRIVLLATAPLSFILPLCIFTIRKVETLPVTFGTAADVEITGLAAEGSKAVQGMTVLEILLLVIYISGILVIIAKTMISIARTRAIISSGTRRPLESGEILSIVREDIAPFSWMNCIVVSDEDYKAGCDQIVIHEKAHITLHHSFDVLFMDTISAFQWFNPAIWLLKYDLRAVHEYEADAAVLRSGADIREYQYLLIRKTVSKSGYSVANSFNHSILKNRITMMSKSKSPMYRALRVLYIIPLLAATLSLNAKTVIEYKCTDNSGKTVHDTTAIDEVYVVSYGTDQNPDSSKQREFTETDDPMTPQEFPKWLCSNIRCPEGFSGSVTFYVTFKVDKDGKLTDLKCIDCEDPRLEKECLTVMENSPEWRQECRELSFCIPVTFQTRKPVNKGN